MGSKYSDHLFDNPTWLHFDGTSIVLEDYFNARCYTIWRIHVHELNAFSCFIRHMNVKVGLETGSYCQICTKQCNQQLSFSK